MEGLSLTSPSASIALTQSQVKCNLEMQSMSMYPPTIFLPFVGSTKYSYNKYLVVKKLHIQNLKRFLTVKRKPCIPIALHETHQTTH
jgi:hypothetical protein